jgi:hypothetical protein
MTTGREVKQKSEVRVDVTRLAREDAVLEREVENGGGRA